MVKSKVKECPLREIADLNRTKVHERCGQQNARNLGALTSSRYPSSLNPIGQFIAGSTSNQDDASNNDK